MNIEIPYLPDVALQITHWLPGAPARLSGPYDDADMGDGPEVEFDVVGRELTPGEYEAANEYAIEWMERKERERDCD